MSNRNWTVIQKARISIALLAFFFSLKFSLDIPESSSVITWDFDVLKGDVLFNIFRSKRPPRAADAAAPASAPPARGERPAEKSGAPGAAYSRVESPLMCREGESIQVRARIQTSSRHINYYYTLSASYRTTESSKEQ